MSQAAGLIDALNGTFGRHEGYRASHAKGIAVAGRFVPAAPPLEPDVALLSTEQPVVARFSVGGGKPGVSDKSPTVRGMGLTIGDKREAWTMALISAPVFFANSGEQFKAFLAARVADPALGGPNPDKVRAFNEANPNTLAHQHFLSSTPPCRCYSAERYHSGHTYRVCIADHMVDGRLLLEPESGRHGLTEDAAAALPDNFLHDALRKTLETGPARWRLKLKVANPSDNCLDPTIPWSGDHEYADLGVVEVNTIDETAAGQARVFDPSRLPAGVAAPKDAVFALRGAAYAESVARRACTASMAI